MCCMCAACVWRGLVCDDVEGPAPRWYPCMAPEACRTAPFTSWTLSYPTITNFQLPTAQLPNQIRHMIGGALSVARGMLPLELLAASLCAHSRVTVPRAPPHTLILADCTFPQFRKVGLRLGDWVGGWEGGRGVAGSAREVGR